MATSTYTVTDENSFAEPVAVHDFVDFSAKVPGLEGMPQLTGEQYVEAMAGRFEAEGVSPEQLRMMARKMARKIRTDATKPKFERAKTRQKNKSAAKSRAKNRK
jgi:hypothetical protein